MKPHPRVVVALLATVLAAGLALSGAAHSLELSSVDARFALRGARPALARRVLIVAIDHRTDQVLGHDRQFPIYRRYYAQALDRLDADGASAVAIDVAFTTQSDTADDNALVRGLARHPGTILAAAATAPGARTQVLGGPDGQALARVKVASALFPLDSGVTYRRFRTSESGLTTFATAAAALADPHFSVARLGPQPVWIDFPGPPGTVSRVSLLDLLKGRVPAAEVRGRVAVIGVTDRAALDLHSYSSLTNHQMSGVELEADAVATALDGAPLRLVPWWVALAVTGLVGIVIPVLATGTALRLGSAAVVAGLAAYLLFAQLCFDAGWIVPVVVPVTTLVVAGAAALSLSFTAELARRRQDVQAARRRAVQAGDEARRRVEQDLHDGVQQRLVALAMRLSMPSAQADPELLQGSVDELRVTLAELRELARGTYPIVLQSAGLAGGLRSLADHCSLPVDLRLGPLDGVSAELARSAYFVAAEAFANALKHAGASQMTLSAACRDGMLVLAVDDDGVGGANPEGSGMLGIAERAEAHGGTLTVTSPPGGGTHLTLRVPL